ncbi:MAG: hypothetical protein ABSE28_19000, partial [Candidatus Sulfotelmatobacter sp.]
SEIRAIREKETTNSKSNPTSCSGNHDVMAKRLRPWLAKPLSDAALQVRVSDRGVNQAHSIRASSQKLHPKAECTAAISPFLITD